MVEDVAADELPTHATIAEAYGPRSLRMTFVTSPNVFLLFAKDWVYV